MTANLCRVINPVSDIEDAAVQPAVAATNGRLVQAGDFPIFVIAGRPFAILVSGAGDSREN